MSTLREQVLAAQAALDQQKARQQDDHEQQMRAHLSALLLSDLGVAIDPADLVVRRVGEGNYPYIVVQVEDLEFVAMDNVLHLWLRCPVCGEEMRGWYVNSVASLAERLAQGFKPYNAHRCTRTCGACGGTGMVS